MRIDPLLRSRCPASTWDHPRRRLVAAPAVARHRARAHRRQAPLRFASRAEMHEVGGRGTNGAASAPSFKRLDGRARGHPPAASSSAFGHTGTERHPLRRRAGGCPLGSMRWASVRRTSTGALGRLHYRPMRNVPVRPAQGVVRGTRWCQSTLGRSKYKVGLNYAAPSVRVASPTSWHLDSRASHQQLEVGSPSAGGARLIIGRSARTRSPGAPRRGRYAAK